MFPVTMLQCQEIPSFFWWNLETIIAMSRRWQTRDLENPLQGLGASWQDIEPVCLRDDPPDALRG